MDQLEMPQEAADDWGPVVTQGGLAFTGSDVGGFNSALRLATVDGEPVSLAVADRASARPAASPLWITIFKGCIDKVGALIAIILIAPVLLAVAVAIKVSNPGPVFYRQTRVGRAGRCFQCLKFRTMVVDADKRRDEILHRNEADGLLFKIKDDPRVTPVGRWLRRLSLDELPQLFHVLTGRMSLVGPRPALPIEVDAYDDTVRGRLAVKPGLTGLWQVSGRSDLSWDDAVRLDLYYVEHVSLRLDVMIILRTIPAVLFARGAY